MPADVLPCCPARSPQCLPRRRRVPPGSIHLDIGVRGRADIVGQPNGTDEIRLVVLDERSAVLVRHAAREEQRAQAEADQDAFGQITEMH